MIVDKLITVLATILPKSHPRPVIRVEGRHGQAVAAVVVVDLIIGPGVADGDRILDFVAPDFHLIGSNNFRLGARKLPVLAGDGETLGLRRIKGIKSLPHVIEGQNDLIAFFFHRPVSRASELNILVVIISERPARQPVGYGLFVF